MQKKYREYNAQDWQFRVHLTLPSVKSFLGLLRCSTCPLGVGCWELSHVISLMLKVSKSQKQIMASWILPKNERWGNFQKIKLPQRSFFGRIQDNIFFFEIFWPLRKKELLAKLSKFIKWQLTLSHNNRLTDCVYENGKYSQMAQISFGTQTTELGL